MRKSFPALGDAERVVEASNAHGRKIKELRNRVLVYTLHSTGARVSELLALKRSDIDWDNGRVWIDASKRGVDHWSFFYPECLQAMKQFSDARALEKHTSLIPSTKAGHDSMTRHQAHVVVVKLAEEAGVKNFHPHSFRHSLGIRIVRSAGNIKMAQMLLGHKSIETTSKFYSDLMPEDLAAGHEHVFSMAPNAPAQVVSGTVWNGG